ncbi:MAG: hypothetical protein ACRD5D_07000 [Candidatus Polarisedimenticolia bacterium]
MRHRSRSTLKLLTPFAVALLAAAGPAVSPVLAQTEETQPSPVVIVGNTRFIPLLEEVVLAPGERLEREVEVGRFSRISLLAAGEAGAPTTGRIVVGTLFGPPNVPVPNGLALGFAGGTRATGSANLPVMGPRLTLVLANATGQRVRVTLSLFAAK